MNAELGFVPKDSLSSYVIVCSCVYSNMGKFITIEVEKIRHEFSSSSPGRRGENQISMVQSRRVTAAPQTGLTKSHLSASRGKKREH